MLLTLIGIGVLALVAGASAVTAVRIDPATFEFPVHH